MALDGATEGIGLPVAKTEMAQFEDQRVLVVERFDRAIHPDGWIVRIPHEDLLQAQGLPSHLRYESDGGPGVSDTMDLLRGSANARDDRQTLFKALLYFWLLAATDGHAKNFSLAIAPGGTFKLAPLYDVLSAWPWVGSSTNKVHLRNIKMAMALHTKNAHYRMREIYQRHWLAVGDGISAQGLQRPSWKSYQVPWKVQSHLCKRKFRKDFPFMS